MELQWNRRCSFLVSEIEMSELYGQPSCFLFLTLAFNLFKYIVSFKLSLDWR